jgi:hypothetical protein
MAMQNPNCAEMPADMATEPHIGQLRAARSTLARTLELYHSLGVERVMLPMPEDKAEILLPILDEVAWVTSLDFVFQDRPRAAVGQAP